MSQRIALTGFALLLATCGGANATTIYRTAVSGAPLKLAHFSSVNPDCSWKGKADIRVTSAPQHGSIRMSERSDFSNFAADGVAARCNLQRVRGTSVYFQSEKGFLGTDYVTFDVIYPTGFERNDTYEITVK